MNKSRRVLNTQVCKQTCMRNTARVLVLCGNVQEFLMYECVICNVSIPPHPHSQPFALRSNEEGFLLYECVI